MKSFTLFIKTFQYSLYKIITKKQVTHLKEAKKLTKFKKFEAISKIFIIIDIFFLFEDKFIEVLGEFENNMEYYKSFN